MDQEQRNNRIEEEPVGTAEERIPDAAAGEDPFDAEFWNTPAEPAAGDEAAEGEELPAEPPKAEISYVLKMKEIKTAFELLGSFKMNTKGQWIRTALLAVVIAITTYNITLDQSYLGMGIFLIALCVLLIAAIWVVPVLSRNSAVKKAYDPDPTIVRFYDDRVATGKAGFLKFREIPLTKDTGVERGDGVYVVKMPEKRFIVIPERAIPYEDLETVRAILFGWNRKGPRPEPLLDPLPEPDDADPED